MGKGASGASAEPQEQRSLAQHVHLSPPHTHTPAQRAGVWREWHQMKAPEFHVPWSSTSCRQQDGGGQRSREAAGGGGLPQSGGGKAEQPELRGRR